MSGGVKLNVEVAGVNLKNPVLIASGVCGYGLDFRRLVDYRPEAVGGLVLKGTTLKPREGNPPIRIVETAGGVLNSIGLQNMGVDALIREVLPQLAGSGTAVILNIAGHNVEEYAEVAQRCAAAGGFNALEVNISCPNVAKGGMAFGTDPCMAAEVVGAVTSAVNGRFPVIAKLSPAAGDIAAVGLACVEAGADALSLINTVPGMAIDARRRRPVLANVVGGLSGPAIKPIALLRVRQVFLALKRAGKDIPLIGMGGIVTAEDALEFILAGATAVQIGTATFYDPLIGARVAEGLEEMLLDNYRCSGREKDLDIRHYVGALED
ncbi:MAG: dihydroorotate dehydrogenase [bacterium]|nr:dihydroorotate dehydrogenase [bacterium]